MRSPKWLRRIALPLALLGVVHLVSSLPTWAIHFAKLPLEQGLAALFMYVCTGLWIVGSGFVLGFLAEADRIGEEWAAPFARGVTNFLVVGGVLSLALMWSSPLAWFFCPLAVLARLFARKPEAIAARTEEEPAA